MPEFHKFSVRNAQIVNAASTMRIGDLLDKNPDVLGIGSSSVVIALGDTKVLAINYKDDYLLSPLMIKGQVYRQRIAHMLFPDNFPCFYACQSSYVDNNGQVVHGFTVRERIISDESRWMPQDYHLPPPAECLYLYSALGGLRLQEVKIRKRLLIAASYGIPLINDTGHENIWGNKEYAIYVDALEDGFEYFQNYYLQGKLSWWNEDKIVELMDYMGRFTIQDKKQVLNWSRRAKYLEVVRLSIDAELLDPVAEKFNPKDALPQAEDNFNRFCEQGGVQGMDFNAREVERYIDLMYRTKKALYDDRVKLLG